MVGQFSYDDLRLFRSDLCLRELSHLKPWRICELRITLIAREEMPVHVIDDIPETAHVHLLRLKDILDPLRSAHHLGEKLGPHLLRDIGHLSVMSFGHEDAVARIILVLSEHEVAVLEFVNDIGVCLLFQLRDAVAKRASHRSS